MAFVLAAGFDRASPEGAGGDAGGAPNPYRVTAQVPVAERLPGAGGGGGGGGAGQGPATFTITAAGETPMDAAHRLIRVVPKRPYWGQLQIAAIGEDLARQDVSGVFDMLARAPEVPETAKLVVARGSAADLLRASPQLDPIPARALSQLITQSREESALPVIDIHEFVGRLVDEGIEPIAPLAERTPQGEFRFLGTAVFSGPRMVGSLNEFETEGYMWVRSTSSEGFVALPCTPEAREGVSVEVHRRRAHIRVEDRQGSPAITIEIAGRGILVDDPCLAPLRTTDRVKQIERLIGQHIRSHVEAALARARELRADVFGLGREIHRRRPAAWQQLRQGWPERFADLPVEVRIHFTLAKRGLIIEPNRPDDPGDR